MPSEADRAFGRIDVLVNNAGYDYLAAVEEEEEKNIRAIGYLAAVEEGEEKDIHAIFETNFFGVAEMIQVHEDIHGSLRPTLGKIWR